MKRNGFAQIPVMIGLLIMAVAVPVATKLVQQSQDTRNKAAGCAAAGEMSYSGHPCCPGLESYSCSGSGSFATCKCRVKPANPTATPVPPSTRTCTWKTCETITCRTHTEERPYNQACPSSNCTSDANCHIITPTALPTAACTQVNATCITDSNCCSGLVCKQDGQYSDRWSCQVPCKTNGSTVSNATQCCSEYASYNGSSLVCGVKPTATPTQRPCIQANSTCTSGNLCCGSNVCRQDGAYSDRWACLPPVTPTQVPLKPCCCNSGDIGTNCFWSDTSGRCHTTQSVDPWQGAYANPVTDTSKCSGTNPNPTGTCAQNYTSCGNGATKCCSSDFECKSTYGGYFCMPKPGTTGNPTQCTNGATKCQSEIANISYEYKCTNGSWVKDKRCDGVCNGNTCASFTKCTEGETKCNNTTKVFEKCVKVGSAATGYTTNWQGTYCEAGCNSDGCIKPPRCGVGLYCNSTSVPTGSSKCTNSSGTIMNCCPSGQIIKNGVCTKLSPCGSGLACGPDGSIKGATSCASNDPNKLPVIACCAAGQIIKDGACVGGGGTNPSPTSGSGVGSGCDGAIPRDICEANKLSVNAQCINNGWDYDVQLCDQTGRKETCGGRPYCCPSVGGQWTTDMTACGGSGACTQCAGHPDWKVKGDADCSGTTTINDFSVWKSEYISGNFGTDTKNSWNADFNCDGKVTLNDGSIWTANFIKGLTN